MDGQKIYDIVMAFPLMWLDCRDAEAEAAPSASACRLHASEMQHVGTSRCTMQ